MRGHADCMRAIRPRTCSAFPDVSPCQVATFGRRLRRPLRCARTDARAPMPAPRSLYISSASSHSSCSLVTPRRRQAIDLVPDCRLLRWFTRRYRGRTLYRGHRPACTHRTLACRPLPSPAAAGQAASSCDAGHSPLARRVRSPCAHRARGAQPTIADGCRRLSTVAGRLTSACRSALRRCSSSSSRPSPLEAAQSASLIGSRCLLAALTTMMTEASSR